MSGPFMDTVVVRAGDAGYPSLPSIVLAASSLGVGVMTGVASDGSLAFVRIPHPPVVVETLMRLAVSWDDASARIKAFRSGEIIEELPPEGVKFAIYDEKGKVWITFGSPIEGMGLEPDEAQRIGEHLTKCAQVARGWKPDEIECAHEEVCLTLTHGAKCVDCGQLISPPKKVNDDGSGPIEA